MRRGANEKLPKGAHTRRAVYGEMLGQVVMDFAGIGDFRELTESEVEFFYELLRPALIEHTKPKG